MPRALNLCAVVVLAACELTGDFSAADFYDAPLLRGESVNAMPVLGQPFELRVSGDRLWVGDIALDPSLHMLDLGTVELLMSMARRGEGPGEFRGSPQVQVRPGDLDGAVWVFDRMLQRMTRFDPRAPLDDPLVISLAVGEGGNAYRAIWLTSDRILGVHASDDSRFSLFSATGARMRTVSGELLGPEDASRTRRIRETVGGFVICPWPGRGFAIAYTRAGRIEYYNLAAQLVRTADVPYASNGFVPDADGALVPNRERSYYRSCAVNEDRLYAAFSGRFDANYADNPATPDRYASEFLHVFDWTGELQAVNRLEPAVHSIEISAEDSTMLATSLTTAEIYRFPLLP
ncbi:MAG: BF3164 family lipoprotein [Gemmatimonadota bacterium]